MNKTQTRKKKCMRSQWSWCLKIKESISSYNRRPRPKKILHYCFVAFHINDNTKTIDTFHIKRHRNEWENIHWNVAGDRLVQYVWEIINENMHYKYNNNRISNCFKWYFIVKIESVGAIQLTTIRPETFKWDDFLYTYIYIVFLLCIVFVLPLIMSPHSTHSINNSLSLLPFPRRGCL